MSLFNITFMTPIEEEVLRILVDQKILTIQQASDIKKNKDDNGTSLRDVLVNSKVVNEETYTEALATAMKLPYINLKGFSILRDVLSIIPESMAREHLIIAYEQTENELHVAMTDSRDRQIIEFINKKVDKQVVVALASEGSIRAALALYQESLEMELKNILDTIGVAGVNDDLSKAAEDLPVIRVTDLLLKHAILQDASDIHIEPTEKQVIVRYRVDGILHDALTLPRIFLAGLVARIKVLSNLKIDEHRLPQDGRFKIKTDDYNIAFRVSILPVYDGEKIVMRLLDESGKGLDLDSIGMRQNMLEIFRRSISEPNGMILVTGPTGSGKTTTLYASMRELNTRDVNISTVEDPIEYRMPRINQTQVNPRIGLTFSNGLRSLVRQDPDILMVGEIRDEETASLAVNASLTGHLVLSTLHTNSAAGALPRLLDMKVEAFLIASTVNVLVAQRLVRKLCPECKQKTKIDKELLSELSKLFDIDELLSVLKREKIIPEEGSWEDIPVYKAGECKKCHAGYKGRIGIYEIIEFTDEIRELITPHTSSRELEDAAKKQQNMVTMIEEGFIKVAKGITTVEEILRVAKE